MSIREAEIIRLADEHTRGVQAWLASRAPGAARFQGRGAAASSTGLNVRLLNLALGAHFPPGTPNHQIDQEIHSVKRFFEPRQVPWAWWVGPNAHPQDFASRLAEQGLSTSRDLPAMAARLPAAPPAGRAGLRVWQARGRRDLRAASLIRRKAFAFPPGAALTYFEDMAEDWLNGDPACLYLAGPDPDSPMAIGALIEANGYPGVYIMATRPDRERSGLGSCILEHILAEASARGHDLIFLTAGVKGFPLYSRFGFEHIFSYRLAWRE